MQQPIKSKGRNSHTIYTQPRKLDYSDEGVKLKKRLAVPDVLEDRVNIESKKEKRKFWGRTLRFEQGCVFIAVFDLKKFKFLMPIYPTLLLVFPTHPLCKFFAQRIRL